MRIYAALRGVQDEFVAPQLYSLVANRFPCSG